MHNINSSELDPVRQERWGEALMEEAAEFDKLIENFDPDALKKIKPENLQKLRDWLDNLPHENVNVGH